MLTVSNPINCVDSFTVSAHRPFENVICRHSINMSVQLGAELQSDLETFSAELKHQNMLFVTSTQLQVHLQMMMSMSRLELRIKKHVPSYFSAASHLSTSTHVDMTVAHHRTLMIFTPS